MSGVLRVSLHQLIGLTLRGTDRHVLGQVVDIVFVPVTPGPIEVPRHQVEGGLVAWAMVAPPGGDARPMPFEITRLEHDPAGDGIIPAASAG